MTGRALWLFVVLLALAVGTAASAGAAARRWSPQRCGRVATGGRAPAWLPGGKRIAYLGPAAHPVSVVVADVTGPAHRCAVASVPPGDTLEEVGWGADGRIVYADTNYTLFSLDRKSGKTREIGTELGVVGNGESVFSLSRNRREVAFTANCRCAVQQGTRVGVTSVTGGRVWWLSRPWPGRAEAPSFSPDENRVAFEIPSGIAVEPTHRGRIKTFPIAGRCLSTAWSPNGRWIACLSPGGGAYSTLDLINTGTGRTRALASSVVDFSWAPNSKELAIQGPNAVIGTTSLSGKTRLFALKGLRAGVGLPAWSPVGRSIAFPAISTTNEQDSRIYLIHPDGRHLRRIA
jgi:Tol biopolymer transport system component